MYCERKHPEKNTYTHNSITTMQEEINEFVEALYRFVANEIKRHATNEWKQGNPEPFTDEKFAAAIKAANAYGHTL